MTNWHAAQKRALMRRRGVEAVRGTSGGVCAAPESHLPPVPQPSKEAMRVETEAAVAEWLARKGADAK